MFCHEVFSYKLLVSYCKNYDTELRWRLEFLVDTSKWIIRFLINLIAHVLPVMATTRKETKRSKQVPWNSSLKLTCLRMHQLVRLGINKNAIASLHVTGMWSTNWQSQFGACIPFGCQRKGWHNTHLACQDNKRITHRTVSDLKNQ